MDCTGLLVSSSKPILWRRQVACVIAREHSWLPTRFEQVMRFSWLRLLGGVTTRRAVERPS
jgi:hypothetical protein